MSPFLIHYLWCYLVAKSYMTLCDPMGCSSPGLCVLHYLLEFAQIHVLWVCDAIWFIFFCLVLLLPSIFPSISVFSSESAHHIRWPNIGASVSASVLPVNVQGWFPLGLTGLISLQSKEFSRVFSNTTVQEHQCFSTQLSLWSTCHIHTWLLEKP